MANQEHITDVVKPYDWTYSTKYNGSNVSTNKDHLKFVPTTEESIDIEQLKRPDPILFYDENILFEDELADNGTAVLSTKVVCFGVNVPIHYFCLCNGVKTGQAYVLFPTSLKLTFFLRLLFCNI